MVTLIPEKYSHLSPVGPVLIVGATGQQGGAVARHLQARGIVPFAE
jgi:hypothetical protein